MSDTEVSQKTKITIYIFQVLMLKYLKNSLFYWKREIEVTFRCFVSLTASSKLSCQSAVIFLSHVFPAHTVTKLLLISDTVVFTAQVKVQVSHV